jgi:terminase, large subunit
LDTHIFQSFDTHDNRQLPIRAVCVDSGGHYTNSVYAYAKKNAGRRVFAIKGVGGEGRAIVSRPSKNNIGKCPLFPIGVDTAKDLLFARLRINDPGAGFIHFSDTLNDEYFRQLTAEKIVTRYHRGFKKRMFQKMRPRNEALDCFVYAIAAYAIIGININALSDKLSQTEQEQEQKPKAPIRQPFIPKVGRNFVNSWR